MITWCMTKYTSVDNRDGELKNWCINLLYSCLEIVVLERKMKNIMYDDESRTEIICE